MSDLWYPRAVRMDAPTSLWNSFTGGKPKMILHTTEGGRGVVQQSGGLYFGRSGTMPNATLAIAGGRWAICQHIPNNYGADALLNAPGGVQTNRANCVQVEIAWKASEIADLPDEAFQALADYLAWDHTVRGTELNAPFAFAAAGHAHRLTFAEWDTAGGVLGHQHVPENDHTDPGALDVGKLLRLVGGTTSEGDPVMSLLEGLDFTSPTFHPQGECLDVLQLLLAAAGAWIPPLEPNGHNLLGADGKPLPDRSSQERYTALRTAVGWFQQITKTGNPDGSADYIVGPMTAAALCTLKKRN